MHTYLVQARRLGTSEADLLKAYPTLRAEDLAHAWAFFRVHLEEIEQQILENEAAQDKPCGDQLTRPKSLVLP